MLKGFIKFLLTKLGILDATRSFLFTSHDTAKNNAEPTNKNNAPKSLDSDYQKRLDAERRTFNDMINVHALPAIFHYWSNKHLLPTLTPFGFNCPNTFYCKYLEQQINLKPDKRARFISIGAGNCDTEVTLAVMLRERGYTNFLFECMDINDDMLTRGAALAKDRGVTENIAPQSLDFNYWQPEENYDVVIANQSLHHIEQLENLFVNIKKAIGTTGVFVTCDMIGRNGHMRWPEALEIVHELWREMPPEYQYNHQLKRYEELYENWDCSTEGFEGVRAQDILPLLIQHFYFDAFFSYGNIIDVFIDRGFGHNFDIEREWDRNFIDKVHARDVAELLVGNVKPVHLLAAMRNTKAESFQYIAPFTPEYSLRHTK